MIDNKMPLVFKLAFALTSGFSFAIALYALFRKKKEEETISGSEFFLNE